MCNGPLIISAHGRLNWSDKVRTGELIFCNNLANISLHDASKQNFWNTSKVLAIKQWRGSEFSGSDFSGSDFSRSEFSGSEFSGSEV